MKGSGRVSSTLLTTSFASKQKWDDARTGCRLVNVDHFVSFFFFSPKLPRKKKINQKHRPSWPWLCDARVGLSTTRSCGTRVVSPFSGIQRLQLEKSQRKRKETKQESVTACSYWYTSRPLV